MNKKFYITTSIAYTNDKPHIGYALELVQADALARYYKLQGRDVYFLTGTDDHGTKIYRRAKELGKSPQEYTKENIQAFKTLTKKLNITNSDFISTSDRKKHWAGAIALWKALEKSGDIYKKKYTGQYCVGCEAFVTGKDLVDGKCPNHNKKPEKISEENYFFKFSKYKKKIIDLIKKDQFQVIPVERKNEILNVLKDLDDVSFSRPKSKLPWGIPVPGDESQTMYVWCDALSNYISALGYGQNYGDSPHKSEGDCPQGHELLKKYWPADIHCIGKDILKFHAAYWPAMLLSAGLKLPKKIFVHGYITSEGQKMSKSLGNVVDPLKLIEKYGVDPVRYYLLREIPATGDGDFSQKRFDELYNKELANELGNLVNRVATMVENHFKSQIVNLKSTSKILNLEGIDEEKSLKIDLIKVDKYIENFQFNEALKEIWKIVHRANEFIEEEKPWELVKDESRKERLVYVLVNLIRAVNGIGYSLKPFLPETAEKISRQFNKKDLIQIKKTETLFPRLY